MIIMAVVCVVLFASSFTTSFTEVTEVTFAWSQARLQNTHR
jgi:hypothetical protein